MLTKQTSRLEKTARCKDAVCLDAISVGLGVKTGFERLEKMIEKRRSYGL